MDVDVARLALLKLLPTNPITEAERAIKRSIRLVKQRITSFANHYGHLVRVVNQLFGRYACKEWKSWWVTLGMLQFRKHCDGKDHSKCNRWLFYSTCGAKTAASREEDDVIKSWHVKYTLSTAQPLGISLLAQLVLTMYTLEAKFQRRVMQTIQFGRTNELESFFHLVDINTPMYTNAPERLDKHNLNISKLMWNESKEHRAVAAGKIQKSEKKGGVSMYYAKTARRQPVQLWQCVAMRLTLTGDDNEPLRLVEAWVEKMIAVVQARYRARKERVKKIDAETEAKIKTLSGVARLAAHCLFCSTAEGTLHPERSEDGEHLFFTMPDYIAKGKVKFGAPYPLKRGVADEEVIDLTLEFAELEAIADECDDKHAGSDVEDEDEMDDEFESESELEDDSMSEGEGESCDEEHDTDSESDL
jgi:hypothetical protein